MNTIVYYTDNQLDEFLFNKCQEKLIEAADGKRIISVSQKPINLGDNIVLDGIGRSHHSLFTQILTGARAADTKYVALAEHDCLYSKEHFNWIPPNDTHFWYNLNHWFAQWGGAKSGLYSFRKRRVLSNLICNRELLIEHVSLKLRAIEGGAEIRKGVEGACEFGVIPNMSALRRYKDIGKGIGLADSFTTEVGNIDIRHGGNFTGGRKAHKRRYSIPYWGDFHSVMGIVPPGNWYQEAVINNKPVPTRRKKDTNEKRWKTFIEPHIKLNGGIVQDLGCNAGFYCRKMADRGFRAIGVERDREFIRHNRYWETQDPKGVELVESDITKYNPICSHYAFLANVHYWISPEHLEELVGKLRDRVLNVVVIGRYKPYKGHKSPCDLEYLMKLFNGWTMGDVIEKGKHFSVIFKNPDLIQKNVDDIFFFQQLSKSRRFLPSYNALIDSMLNGEEFDPKETDYWKYLQWRRHRNKEQLLKRHISLVNTMQTVGIVEPLTIGRVIRGKYIPNRLQDGDHRLIVARKLGMKDVICRINKPER